CTARYSGFSFW
nr:immunoglobulin heavy chain junction region [Macaca mulatta]MOV35988.1 immunoglobulin heavy chain junction region [Macaca mulatta]MOV36189.1 immunoglobulin heavy chain junction region [Macaca mulatta]MOV36363.1 immunoglobulin heavy chain junction region [Macaca mulatta]MOV36777.1 immunoglobulin heavy chain junction region [Macaca mulatta]